MFSKANRQLTDEYWVRTKPRKEPYDDQLPVLEMHNNFSSHGMLKFTIPISLCRLAI